MHIYHFVYIYKTEFFVCVHIAILNFGLKTRQVPSM